MGIVGLGLDLRILPLGFVNSKSKGRVEMENESWTIKLIRPTSFSSSFDGPTY